jgi:hypothetical protein
MMSITAKPASLLLAAEIAVDRVISMHALPTPLARRPFSPLKP